MMVVGLGFVLVGLGFVLVQGDVQPTIITLEKLPSRKVWGSISLPEGSPWCDGKPAYWLVGHQPTHESPWCLSSGGGTTDFSGYYNYTDSQWELSSVAVLDTQDELNQADGPTTLDRHDCALMDVNQDGAPDVLCGVGANKGTGLGFNEVYVTQTEDSELGPKGSLVKTLLDHGLNKYPTMRNRFMETLKAADGSSMVFLATKGVKRADGEKNQHRMFRLKEGVGSNGFYFRAVSGPWITHTEASCLQIVDVNNDGIDDILMCNKKKQAFIFLQGSDGTWSRVKMPNRQTKDWRSARVADIDGDGIKDLVVVVPAKDKSAEIRAFKGLEEYPYFNFERRRERLLDLSLPYAAPDVEVVDANQDGIADLYVVQVDEATVGAYCGNRGNWDPKPYTGVQPPADFVPDKDVAPDLLLLGSPSGGGFTTVSMAHSEPGCGYVAERFGNNRTMILTQGSTSHPGHNLLLQW